MLPSLGCFSSLECPFYNGGAGQCSRPYCHYRHVKRDPNASPEPTEDILGVVPTVNPIQIKDEGKAGGSGVTAVKSSRAAVYKAIVEAAPTYDPTPISQLKSSHIPIHYTPTNPTRSSAVKKSKPSSEYVPHYVGTHRPTYPPYCPSSISSLNCQVQSTSLDDPLKNPLYEIYGPEGAQYSPNDVEPVGSGYSYAPTKSSSYAPYSPEYVTSSHKVHRGPPDSQLSDDDDNVDLAAETAAQTNGSQSGDTSLIDLVFSEIDQLDFEFEESKDEKIIDITKADKKSESSSKTAESHKSYSASARSHKAEPSSSNAAASSKAEKRRSNSTSSNSEVKKQKVSDNSDEKNGHKEKKSSSSSNKKSSSSSSSSHSKTSSGHSSSKSKSSSSSSSSRSTKSSKASSTDEGKNSHSDHKTKSSSSSKHKTKHHDKDSIKIKEKGKHREKEKDSSKNKHSHKSSSHTDSKAKQEKLEEEIRMMEAELDASLEDEDMIEQQCYEMFSEYSETMHSQSEVSQSNEDQRVTISEELAPSAPSKKRVAHQSAQSSAQPASKTVPTLAKKCSPYQVMRDRWEMLKKEKMQALEARASLAMAPTSIPRAAAPSPYSATNIPPASLPSVGTGKKKIASVPNVALLLKPRPTSQKSISSQSEVGTSPSRFYNKESQRVDEFGRLVKVRVAHTPNMDAPVMRKPVVNPSDCRTFKVATRQANVNKLYQAYLDAGFGDASHDMALEAEKSSTQGTSSLGVYSHRIIQRMKDLRACAETSQSGPKMDGMSGIPNRVVSHNAMLAGKLGAKVSWSIQSGKKETETKPCLSLYEQLQSYILSKEKLEENGFPMPSKEKGLASIKPSAYRVIQQPADPLQRICVRCLKPYAINKRGEQVKEEECLYHWGRKMTTRRYREAETKYTCCDGTESGCSVSPYHVFEQDWGKSKGYMSTLSKPWMESDPGVYALDCEMCYTTAGLELTRVTVIKEDLSVVYEALVKPSHKILDYNTRFSGITEEDLKDVDTSILKVQATLLGMFCDKTILIGHSLESDMKALKLIHPTVIDTSVVFPHKMGPPQKRALRNLAADYLKKIIQNDVRGHDSKEDAVAALELMLWKLKDDEKTR